MFTPTAKRMMPTKIPTSKANTEVETQPLTAEMKENIQSNLKP